MPLLFTDPRPPRICVVLPTFNNARTIAAVIEGVRNHVPDIIVVNDGAIDSTEEVLCRFEGIEVITFAKNRGKGAALDAGMMHAANRGFTHAITVDTDGQHRTEELPRFIDTVLKRPEALVLGVRRLPKKGRRPLKTRLMRFHSNFWVWVLTRKTVGDSQTGFRAYPLRAVRQLYFNSVKYDYEMEALVKLIWMGVPIRRILVTADYGPGSESHFRLLRDSFWWSRLTARLLCQIVLLPANVRKVMHLRSFRNKSLLQRFLLYMKGTILREATTPPVFAKSVGVGIFLGVLPIWGFQMIAGIAAANRMKLSVPLTAAATHISTGPMLPIILYASLLLGKLATTGALDLSLNLDEFGFDSIFQYLLEYLIGSFILAVICGIASYFIAYAAALRWMTDHRKFAR